MKKIFTITESERESILSKHESYKKSLIKEQETVSTGTPTTTASTVTASTPTAAVRTKDCTTTKNPARCKQKVLDVQVKINDKCTKITQKLVEDGVYGTNTANAIKACTGMDFSQAPSTQQSVPGGPVGAGITTGGQSGTQGGPAGTTQDSSSTEQFDSLTV